MINADIHEIDVLIEVKKDGKRQRKVITRKKKYYLRDQAKNIAISIQRALGASNHNFPRKHFKII